MIRIENDCVGPCPQGCVGCGLKRVPHWYCDVCDAEVDEGELWNVDGTQMCKDCVLEAFPKVDPNDERGYD